MLFKAAGPVLSNTSFSTERAFQAVKGQAMTIYLAAIRTSVIGAGTTRCSGTFQVEIYSDELL